MDRLTPSRIALLGTPRSGNTWLRLLLSSALECESVDAHSPEEVPWEALPDAVVLQLHEPANADLRSTLDLYEFQAVAVARHPLDVLVSILHFARHDPSPSRWLEDESGDELTLVDASPLDAAFAAYATGPRAQALLGVTCGWWTEAGAIRVRYEDVCGDPQPVLESLLGETEYADLAEVTSAHTLGRLQESFPGQHFWQGKPGHWRNLLLAPLARRIAAANPRSFELLGYECDPDEDLTFAAARENWRKIAKPPTLYVQDRAAAVRATNARDLRHMRAQRFELLRVADPTTKS